MSPLKKKEIIDPQASYFDITFHVLKANKEKYLACLDKIGKYSQIDPLIPA